MVNVDIQYVLTEAEALLAFAQVRDHCEALKNWIASAVEQMDTAKAVNLVRELRDHQRLFARLNVPVHREQRALS